MSKIKTLAIAAALFAGATSLAAAQGTMGQGTGTNGNSPSQNSPSQMTGGAGAHKDTPRTGAADTQQKIQNNQNGYSGDK
jgi:hypothetical protein